MKKMIVVAVLLLCSGCGTVEMAGSKTLSGLAKLNRKVTLYAADGHVIRTWQGKMMLQDEGGGCTFMLDGKRVNIAGTYTVEEY